MTQPSGTLPTIDVTEAARRTADAGATGPLVVDVRELSEFIAMRVPGAALVPMSTFAERHAALPRDRQLLVLCASGNRSAAATAFLLRSGWTDVVNVAGGITDWNRAGLPVRSGPPEPGEGDL
jgi:rhodanese-related sulfurtransferase